MAKISKTAALKAASSASSIVRRDNGRGTTYFVYTPYDVKNPRDKTTYEHKANYYSDAVRMRSESIAITALKIMDKLNDDSRRGVENHARAVLVSHSAKSLLEAGLKEFDAANAGVAPAI